jgi:hypothetical protein
VTAPDYIAVVIPCLNEGAYLAATCDSLGFSSAGPSDPLIALHLIDNGSIDDTREVAERVRRDARHGSVHIGFESVRGYVPPRQKGVQMVIEETERLGIRPADVVIVQADADTRYEPGYLDAIVRPFLERDEPMVVEGHIEFDDDFRLAHPNYVRAIQTFDDAVVDSLAGLADLDELVVDAVAAYRLRDYVACGGHRVELTDNGEELHAETTRLCLSGRARGFIKRRADSAIARPSQRKAESHPILDFAMAGFPRSEAWQAARSVNWQLPMPLEDFATLLETPELGEAKKMRRRHFVALLGVLPLHVQSTLGEKLDAPTADLQRLATQLPNRTRSDLAERPGIILNDVLRLVDNDDIWSPEL